MKKVFFLFPSAFLIFTCILSAQAVRNIFSVDDVNADHSIAQTILLQDKTSINNKPFILSNPSDHFRSIATGNWNVLTTWESSPDNGVTPWTAATLVPNSLANIITIRNAHTVTVNSNENMDQVVIENGGILLHSVNTLTVNDGTGDDIIVQGGGVFVLSANSNPPVFSPLAASAKITQGGILRVIAGGMSGIGTGVNAVNYIYQHSSILELTVVYTTNGVTYFPNVAVDTIPVFRSATNLNVGAVGTTTFNGLFEAANSLNIEGSGQKIFRNGITGTGNINGSTSGKFIINGTTARLGGMGLLTLPASGMDIGPSATVTMVSDKSVTGNIALLANALVMLGSFNLTMTGDIGGGSSTSHIVTNGSGKLVINNITGPAPRIFPIGANTSTVNPMAIFNGGGLNYGVRVGIGINPPIAVPLNAVNRTWFVTANGGTPGTVNTNFFYYAGEGNAGFNYTANLELGLYTSAWNVIQTGLVPAGTYQVATTVNNFGNNIEAPLVLANLGAILAINNSIQLSAQKLNGKAILNWTVDNPADISAFIPERSADGRVYSSLAVLTAADLNFTDAQPLPGLNYYRIKMKDKNGKLTYSNIAAILNAKKGFAFISISPNPVVNGYLKLNITAAQKIPIDMVITDMQGRVIQLQRIHAIAGFNTVPVNVTNLAKGTYQVSGYAAGERPAMQRFVIQ